MAKEKMRAPAGTAHGLKAGILCGLALMASLCVSAARLPAEYAELEYVESTGVQYVDTGYVPTGRDVVEADFAFRDVKTTQQRVFGTSSWDAGFLTCTFYVNGSGFYAWAYKDGVGNWTSTGVELSGDRRRLLLDGVDNRISLVDAASGDTLYSESIGTTRSKSAALPLLLLANCYNDMGKKSQEHGRLRLYSCAISDSTRQKARDFVPCRRLSDAAIGLYDMVTQTFFGDAAGGGFVAGPFVDGTAFGVSQPENQTLVAGVACTPAVSVTDKTTGDALEENVDYTVAYFSNAAPGEAVVVVTGLGDYEGETVVRTFNVFSAESRLPDGYLELEYLVSSGAEFIQTDVMAGPETSATIDATPLSAIGSSFLFDATPATNVVEGMLFRAYVNSVGLFAVLCGDATGTTSDGSGAATISPWNAWGACSGTPVMPKALERRRVSLDSARGVYQIDGQTVVDLRTARTQASAHPFRLFENFPGRLHSFSVAEGGETTHVFLPCVRVSDGAAGMYDLMADSFLTNASSAGVFTAGPYAFNRELHVAPIAAQPWDGAEAVRPALAVVDRATGAALVEGEDYSLAFAGNDAVGSATVVATGLGAYAGSAATNSFAVYRAGGAFTYASWNVDGLASGPTTNGTIQWNWNVTSAACGQYRTFLSALGADWLGVNDDAHLFAYGTWQLGSRRGIFRDYPQTTLGDEDGNIPCATFCIGRFEILSSNVVEDCALEQRVKVDGQYEAVFVNVRLNDAAATRNAQIAALAARYADEPRVVVSGDFRTECAAPGGTTRTDWAALDPLARAGFRLANVSEPLGPVWGRATPRFARTHVATKGFAVSDVAVREPFASDDDEYGLSDECALVCTLAPLAEGRVMRPSDPVPQAYAGAALTPVVTADAAYDVAMSESAVDVGEYSVVVSLKDKTATAWDDGTTDDLSLTFKVEKAANAWKTVPSVSSTRWERRDGPAGTVSQGVGTFGGTSTCSHTDAQLSALTKGTHRVVFTVPETANYEGLEYAIDVVVTETFRTTVSADGATADVQFRYSDKPRKLYLVYGFADGGNATSAWDNVVCVGDVAPGVTEWTGIELPETIGYEHPNYRFLVSGDYGSASYAMDGLMAQWDAEENAGRGVHEESPTTWTELVNATPIAWTGSPVYGEKGVKMNGAFFEATLAGAADALNAKSLTVQVMMRPDSVDAWKWYQGVFQFGPGSDNRQLVLDTRRQEEAGQGLYTFGGLQYRENTWNGRSVISTPNWYFGTNVLVTVTVDAAGAHLWFDGASAPAFTTVGGGMAATSDLFTFGQYIGNKTYPMTVHSVRIYDRALTAAEVAANYAVDADRFDGRFAEAGELQTATRPIQAEVRGGAWANVRFTASERAQRLWFVWGPKDAGAQTNGWTGAALVADVPAGVASFERLALPAASRGAGRGRFLLSYAEYLSTDYAMDGLLAQWDGIDNAARGVHEDSPASWVDLVGGRAMDVHGTPAFGEKSVHNNAESYFQTTVAGAAAAINAEAFTVQVTLRPDENAWVNYQGIFQFGPGSGNRQLVLDTRLDTPGQAKWSFCGLQYREGWWDGHSVISQPNWYFGSNVLVTVTTDAAGAHLWFDDAPSPVFTTPGGGKAATSDLFTFGKYLNNESYPMTAYAIRIYNRTLTADEIAASRAVDAVRFFDAEPPWQASAPLEISAPTLLIFR